MTPAPELCASQFHVLPRGKRMRYAVFEPAGTPQATVLVAPGRREFIEKKYSELGREFLERNFRIIIFEWRGQGLSDRFLAGAARQRDHITDFGIYIGDLASFFEAVVQPQRTGALLVCGHSMGGHLLLRWLAEHPRSGVTGAILTAPMLALGPRFAHGAALGIGHAVVQLGLDEHYGPGQHDYGVRDRTFNDNPLTHDSERFAFMERYFDAYPDLKVGGVTYGWLYAALKSMRDQRQTGHLKNMTMPIVTLTGSLDRVTPVREIERYLAHLPRAENIVLKGSLHDVLNETEALRAPAWREIDRFLAKV
jgi:lysophospholipase